MQKKEIVPGILNGLAMIAVTFISMFFVGEVVANAVPIIILVSEYIYFSSQKKQKPAVFYALSILIWILYLAFITIASVQTVFYR